MLEVRGQKFSVLCLVISVLCLLSSVFCPLSFAEDRLRAVAVTTTFGEIVREIGGERVQLDVIASPRFNVHFIEPKPSDVRKTSKADVFVSGGLDLEPWSDSVLEAAGKTELFRTGSRYLDLSKDIPLLEVPQANELDRSQGDMHVYGNPHYWMDPENIAVMARTAAEKLKELDPAGSASYEENLSKFLSRWNEKVSEWKSVKDVCKGKEAVSYHKDIAYFADFTGLKVEQYLEPKPGIPPTPQHLAFLESYMKGNAVKSIIMPVFYSKAAAEAVAGHAGARVYHIAQNPGESAETRDLFTWFDANVSVIKEACTQND